MTEKRSIKLYRDLLSSSSIDESSKEANADVIKMSVFVTCRSLLQAEKLLKEDRQNFAPLRRKLANSFYEAAKQIMFLVTHAEKYGYEDHMGARLDDALDYFEGVAGEIDYATAEQTDAGSITISNKGDTYKINDAQLLAEIEATFAAIQDLCQTLFSKTMAEVCEQNEPHASKLFSIETDPAYDAIQTQMKLRYCQLFP